MAGSRSNKQIMQNWGSIWSPGMMKKPMGSMGGPTIHTIFPPTVGGAAPVRKVASPPIYTSTPITPMRPPMMTKGPISGWQSFK